MSDRSSPEQAAILDLAEKNGGRVTLDAVYQQVHGYPPRTGDNGTREAIPATVRASVSRSIRRLVDRGLLEPAGRAVFIIPPKPKRKP